MKQDISTAEGYRLERLEVYNWGTFNQRIWTMTPAGGTALLTGANGSGKSTLVDALLTLLVPYHRRTYNQASGTDKHRERDERSYTLGAWSKQKDSTSSAARPEYLRGKDSYSVLLAVFHNSRTAQDVTLAQVLWVQDDGVNKFFVVAPSAFSIASHFRLEKNAMSELRKQLKARGAEVFDEFAKYSRRFRQLVHLRSDKVFDLINQIVSIKEIGGLNAFVRGHMLEKMNAQERIMQLRTNFENLTRAHDAIQLAQRQLEILEPLVKEANKYAEQQRRIDEAQRCAEVVPLYIASQKRTLLETALAEAREQLTRQHAHLETLLQEVTELNQQQIDLNVAIRNDHLGQQIKQLEQEIQRLREQLEGKRKGADKYSDIAHKVGLQDYRDEASFYETAQRARALLEQSSTRSEELKNERDTYVQDAARLRESYQALDEEVNSLRQRKSQIPRDDVQLRERLVAALHIPEEELPFVGELLRVRSAEKRWEPATERLLHNFGRQMLVPEQYYQRFSRHVDATNLRGRLIYHRINGPRTARNNGKPDRNALATKLEVKPHTPFTEWLNAEISDAYDYHCCETMEEFQNARRALSLNGQIKHGPARHEKDDRSQLGDRKRYVLGWNNTEKLAALEAECTRQENALRVVTTNIRDIEREQGREQERQQWLRQLLTFDSFAAIDWKTDEQHLLERQARMRELEANPDLVVLRRQLEEVVAKYNAKGKERDKQNGAIATLENRINDYARQRNVCERMLNEGAGNVEPLLAQIERDYKHKSFTLETIDQDREEMRNSYSKRATALQGPLRGLAESIINRMNAFRQCSPAMAQDVDASLDAVNDYYRFHEQVKREDLPRHLRRFKELLNDKVIIDINSFKAALEQQEKEIKDSIDRLNTSLCAIDYTPSTYIQLCYERAHDQEIRDFRNDLRACLPDVSQQRTPEANEASFQRIRALIERFEQDERWTSKATDVRNWLDFSAQELYREDDMLKNYYSDSSGKSGGQKTKLAYTILASAIAYRYGLDMDEGRERAFRFVMIDEAFSRSDEMNARYAMELFKQLDLQLLVVTPLDKIHVIEPYISACHFVANNDDENDSKVYNLSIEEYYEQKQAIREGSVRISA